MTRINRNSTIRSGFAFEDVYVLKLCVDWLRVPTLYREIKVQYIPDEVSAFGFAIDDIVVTHSNGRQVFHQVKHTQHVTTDLWGFEKLLQKGLVKWVNSLQTLKKSNSRSSGCLITNGYPTEEVHASLREGKILLNQLKNRVPILGQSLDFISEKDLFYFSSNFEFIFQVSDHRRLELELREILYHELMVTEAGVDKLLLEIGREGRAQHPQVFTLDRIRSLLIWDRPRPLNQNFEVPTDFEFFDQHQHRDIVTSLLDSQGGIKVIIGKPGTGKSTYLSKLYSLLAKNKDVKVARHHYHIAPKDVSLRERLNSDRVKEGLRADFKRMPREILQELSIQNTQDTPLKEFIDLISSHYFNAGGSFILIVDGLDHVIRESDKRELLEFLEEILHPQPGFWIVFGMQEMAVPFLPNTIHALCPRERWIEIKGFSKVSVGKIVRKTIKKNEDHWDAFTYVELTAEIYRKTQGNPLHLRYVLTQLQDKNERVGTDDVRAIVPYREEIKNYYEELWRQLPTLSKTFAFAITALDFKLQEEQLFDLASQFTQNPADITDSYQSIHHLVRNDPHGLSVFHNSFIVFILSQPELGQQQRLLYIKLRDWLSTTDYEELRWSELAKIEYYLGNSQPLLGFTKDWVINSFLGCRNEDQIVKLLGLATDAAFKVKDYKKAISFHIMQLSFAHREYNLSEAIPAMWSEAFINSKSGNRQYPNFEKLEHFQIRNILLDMHERGVIRHMPDEVTERFNELFDSRRYDNDAEESLIQILAQFSGETVQRAYKFIVQFRRRENSLSPHYFVIYLQQLLLTNNSDRIFQLLDYKLTREEKYAIGDVFIASELAKNSTQWHPEVLKLTKGKAHSNLSKLYLLLRENNIPNELELSPHYKFPAKVEFNSGKSAFLVDLFEDNLYAALLLCLSQRRDSVRVWLQEETTEWQVLLLQKFIQTMTSAVDAFQKKTPYKVADFITWLDDLPHPNYRSNIGYSEYRRSVVPHCVLTTIQIISVLNAYNGFGNILSVDDLQKLTTSKWLYRDDLIQILNLNGTSVSDSAFDTFKNYVVSDLQAEKMQFKDRAVRYTNLAQLARRIGRADEAKLFLYKAAENLVSYGNHKDMHLDKVLNCISHCGQAGSDKVNEYLRRVAPYVYNIEYLTDGDETRHFIYEFSEQLAKYDPNLLYNFYFEANEKRDYYRCERLFADIINTMDFSDSTAIAIGNTAIDKISYNELIRLTEKNEKAKSVLKSLQSYLGNIDYSERREDHDYSSHHSDQDSTLYAGIVPEELAKFLDQQSSKNYWASRGDRNRHLLGWCKTWLPESRQNSHNISTLRGIIEPQFSQIDHEVLDYVYSYAYAVDKGFAFNCLVWAAANGNCWSENWFRRLDESKAWWLRAMHDYPDRMEEFYEQSVLNSGKYYDSGSGYFVPIPKVVPFLIDCGRLHDAERVTEYSIDTLELLFPDVDLLVPGFIRNERNIDTFEVLLKRMEWLSPLVRERVATGIADLLRSDTGGEFHRRFFIWLKSQRFESFVCYGLIILLKSLDGKESLTYRNIKDFQVTDFLSARCMATELLLQRISELTSIPIEIEREFVYALDSSKITVTKEEFFKTVGVFLNGLYRRSLELMEQESRLQVWAIWYRFYLQKCELHGITETKEDDDYLRQQYNFMVGRSTILSEILKSTFYVTIDYLYNAGRVEPATHYHATIEFLPVDLSLWAIPVSSVPSWWCKFGDTPSTSADLETYQLTVPIASTLESVQNKKILFLGGPIIGESSHYENTVQATVIWLQSIRS